MKLAKISGKLLAATFGAALLIPAAFAQVQPTTAMGLAKKAVSGQASAEGNKQLADASTTEEVLVGKRDPFQILVGAARKEGPSLPPGKAGLMVGTVRIDGTASSPTGMIAVVSNPQDRVYFVHEGDHLYDGQVEKIDLDGVVFREFSKDAFGKAVEREVTKRIYSSAGDQQ